jgi:hypothetical protein
MAQTLANISGAALRGLSPPALRQDIIVQEFVSKSANNLGILSQSYRFMNIGTVRMCGGRRPSIWSSMSA